MLLLRNNQGQYWNKGYHTRGWSDKFKTTSLFSSVSGILSSYRGIPEAVKTSIDYPSGVMPDNVTERREWAKLVRAAWEKWYGLSAKERLAWMEKDGIKVVPFTVQETDE